jgi:hypothetical protein
MSGQGWPVLRKDRRGDASKVVGLWTIRGLGGTCSEDVVGGWVRAIGECETVVRGLLCAESIT